MYQIWYIFLWVFETSALLMWTVTEDYVLCSSCHVPHICNLTSFPHSYPPPLGGVPRTLLACRVGKSLMSLMDSTAHSSTLGCPWASWEVLFYSRRRAEHSLRKRRVACMRVWSGLSLTDCVPLCDNISLHLSIFSPSYFLLILLCVWIASLMLGKPHPLWIWL